MKANKKLSIAAIALGICALSCAASGAVAFAAETQTTEPTTVLTMQEGASIRAFGPTGIRFTSELSKADYDNLIAQNRTFGTLIVPATYVPQEGITLENYKTLNAVTVQAQNSIAVEADKVTFSGTLVGTEDEKGNFTDFPSTFYNVPLTAVSYYADANGAIVEFASNPQTYSIAYIASALQAKGQTEPYYTTITDAVLADGISFGGKSYSLKENKTIATTLNSQGLKAKYTSDNESVVTVDKDGNLTSVGVGAATVTATIGGKTATTKVNVGRILGNNPTYSDGTSMFVESLDKSNNLIVTPAKFVYSERSATFDIDPSTQYYAEATFTYNVTKDLPVFGLAHFNALNTAIEDHAPVDENDKSGDPYNNAGALFNRRCIESVMTATGKFIIKDLTSGDDHWFENFDKDNIYLNSSFKANASFNKMTIAIARNGNTIYTFVDGKLVDSSDIAWDYWDGALLTTPGIISCGAKNDFTASNITVLSGEAALTKLNQVTAAASIIGNNPTYTTTAGHNIKTYREYLGEDGDVKIKSDRSGEIAATFNMEKSTLYYAEATFNVTDKSNYPAFGLAHFNYLTNNVDISKDAYNGGGRFGRVCVASIKSNSTATFLIGNLTASNEMWHTAPTLYKDTNFQANNFTQMTIAIARTADKMFTFVNGKLVKEIDAPAGYKNVATTPGIITICNAGLFTASNISLLSGTAANDKIVEMLSQSSTISNKSALKELWHVGEADRTVAVAYASSLINADNTPTVIESSDTSVISVNGTTIKAEGEGTATIKLLLNGKQVDSVELIVHPTSVTSKFGNNPTLSDGSKLYTERADASGNITVSSSKNGELAATFDMTASTLYYAEATFYVIDTSKPNDYPAFGLAHYLALNTNVVETKDGEELNAYDAGSRLGRACVASIKSGSGATFLIGNLKASNERWWNAAALYKDANFKANNFTQMTVAIARTADTLYTFVDGKLVQAVAAPTEYNNVATTPGIITICNANRFTASNISLLSGTDAQNKITELTTATNA